MFDPARTIAPGTSMMLVRPTFRPPALQSASVQRVAGNLLAVMLPLGEDLDESEEVLFIIHVAGVRFASAARFVTREGHVVTFHVDGDWRAVDARTRYRFPAAHPAALVCGDAEQPATITDISDSGLGVHCAAAPESLEVELRVTLRESTMALPCWVVAQKADAGRWRLSLVYRDLADDQTAFAGRLYEFYSEAFAASLPLAG